MDHKVQALNQYNNNHKPLIGGMVIKKQRSPNEHTAEDMRGREKKNEQKKVREAKPKNEM